MHARTCVLAIVYVYMYAHMCVQMLRIMSEIMSEGPQNVSVNVEGRKVMQVGQVIVTPITSRSSLTQSALDLEGAVRPRVRRRGTLLWKRSC